MLNCKLPFPSDWEEQLEKTLLQNRGGHKVGRVYVCSPCHAKSWDGIHRNMLAARAYMYYACTHLQTAAVAPHGYMPMLFDDNNPLERFTAMNAGGSILGHCNALYVCGGRISRGMESEIKEAAKRKIPIVLFNADLLAEINEILAGIRGSKRRLKLDKGHAALGLSPEELFEEVEGNA
jgi:hypothetical protein